MWLCCRLFVDTFSPPVTAVFVVVVLVNDDSAVVLFHFVAAAAVIWNGPRGLFVICVVVAFGLFEYGEVLYNIAEVTTASDAPLLVGWFL